MTYCQICGRKIGNDDHFCLFCGERVEPIFSNSTLKLQENFSDRPKNKLIAILLLIFLYPIGLPYMWMTKPFTPKTSRAITFWFLGAIIFGFIGIIIWTSLPGYQG